MMVVRVGRGLNHQPNYYRKIKGEMPNTVYVEF